jgi:hypothetical protein
MVSNVDDACRVWHCSVADPKTAVRENGDIEYMRPCLRKLPSTLMKANEVWWMTDKTPHESLPLKEKTTRSYVRIVMSEVSVWYRQHSTANPLCEPGCEIIETSKFAPDYVIPNNPVSG